MNDPFAFGVLPEHLSAGEPRPLAQREADRHRLRLLSEPAYAPALERFAEEAERFLREPIPELPWSQFRLVWEDGTRHSYQKLYFDRRQRLTAFGILSWLMPERQDYREALLDTIWAICSEFSWCVPAHFPERPGEGEAPPTLGDIDWLLCDSPLTIDLFAAETGFALSEALRLAGDAWPEAVRSRIFRETYRRLFLPFMNNGPFWWETVRNNWASVCAGSIGAAAIHLMDDPHDLAAVLNRALPAMAYFLDGFGDDGACLEGYMYWEYGFGYFTYFAELLHRRTAGTVDLFAAPRARQVALFQQKVFLHGRKVASFSDSKPEADVLIGLTHELSRRYPGLHIPAYDYRDKRIYDHCGRWAPALRNLLWHDPGQPGSERENATYWLPDAQWLISRVRGEGGVFCLAAKGGRNDEPHNHNDLGHFMLLAGNETLMPDMGCGLYTMAYFGSARYDFVGNGSQGHSVPIVGGSRQRAGAAGRATVVQAELSPDCDRLELDLTQAYDRPELLEFTRSWEWRKDGPSPRLVMTDRFAFAEPPESLTERLVFAMPPEPGAAGSAVAAGAHCRLIVDYGGDLEPAVRELAFVDHEGGEQLFYALDLQWSKRQAASENGLRLEFRFEFRFEPHKIDTEVTKPNR